MSATPGDKQRLLLTQIRTDGGTQARVELRHEETIEEYGEKYRNGVAMPELIVFHDEDDQYWLADGFQRYFSLQKIGEIQADCLVREGSQRDAILFAVGANAEHGLKRSAADKRHAVSILLADKEFSDASARQIATLAKVSHALVNEMRGKLAAEWESSTGSSSSAERVVKCSDGRSMNTAPISEAAKNRSKAARVVEGEFADDSPEDEVYERDEPEENESGDGYDDAAPEEADEGSDDEYGESEAAVDEGVPGGLAYLAALEEVPKFKEIIKELGELRRRAEDLHEGPAGHRMAWGRLEIEFKNIIAHIKDSIPVAPCEVCNGDGCKECLNGGFIVESYAKSLKKTA